MGSSLLAGSGTAKAAGSYTDQTLLSFTSSNKLTSQYHVYAAKISQTTRPCAVFQFHGDGAYEFKNPTSSYSLGGSGGIVAQSREHGCITVPILTPDKVGSITWWENGAANALFARELIGKLTADYNIDTTRIWLVGYSGGSQLLTKFFLPSYSSTIKGGGVVVFGGGGVPSRANEKPYAPALTAGLHMHWFTGAIDDGRGGSYNALADAKAGEAHFKSLKFVTSHEYPANTGHGLSGRFGGIVAQQLQRYDNGAEVQPPPPPTTTTPAPPVSDWVHKVAPSSTGAVLTANVPGGTTRTTFRVSAYEFGTQTGFYVYTSSTGAGTKLTLSSSLSPNKSYNYQVESGLDRHVVASGRFVTTK